MRGHASPLRLDQRGEAPGTWTFTGDDAVAETPSAGSTLSLAVTGSAAPHQTIYTAFTSQLE